MLTPSLWVAQRKQKLLASRWGSVGVHTEAGASGPWLLEGSPHQRRGCVGFSLTPLFAKPNEACSRSCQDHWLRPRHLLFLLLPLNLFCVAFKSIWEKGIDIIVPLAFILNLSYAFLANLGTP